MFEYNFGDSEFLMLFLGLITLPYAAARDRRPVSESPGCAWLTCVTQFAGRSIVVIGDVMLDHFMIGRVDRISPEAPVPVVRFEREEYRLGGAANVAHNIAALGGRASHHRAGRRRTAAQRSCERRWTGPASITPASSRIASRPTTRKMRVVTVRNQQVARVDHEARRRGVRRQRGSALVDRSRRRWRDARRDRAVRLSQGRRHAAGHRGGG